MLTGYKDMMASTLAELAIDTCREVLLLGKRRRMAATDRATGFGNRRLFEIRLRRESDRVSPFGRGVGPMVIDADAFNGLDDRYGYQTGYLVPHQLP